MKRGQNAKRTADKKISAILGPQPVETYVKIMNQVGVMKLFVTEKSTVLTIDLQSFYGSQEH